MFDGKIDFMDFNKIKINYGGKLTCRKIFKKRFIIYLVVSILCLILLIFIYTIRNNKLSGISMEIKEIQNKKLELDNNLSLIKNQNFEESINLINFQDQMNSIKNEIIIKNKTEGQIKDKLFLSKTHFLTFRWQSYCFFLTSPHSFSLFQPLTSQV